MSYSILKYYTDILLYFNRSLKNSLLKNTLSVLLLVSTFSQISAQNLTDLSIIYKKNPLICFDSSMVIYTESFISDRFSLKLNNCNLLFNSRTFFELENYFREDIVLYSINNKTSINVISDDFSVSRLNKELNTEQLFSNTYQFDKDNFKFNEYLVNKEYFFNNFMNNVERNQFFYDMYTKNNNIYTNEFSILDFQSVQTEQYLSGTKVWGSIGVAMVGVLMLAPRSVTKWKEGYIDDAMSNLKRAFNEPPVWDEDHWQINYVGHPYAGSLYYNTIRAQGGSIISSFLFSAFISTGWEYVYEGVAEQPSIQDLFVTPIAGAILGELIHQATLGMKKNGFSVFEAAFVTVFNPMYVITNGYN
ncbi:hypothetical protein MNBD_IGNAVI01-1151 [hydrothermal vent metagenome]|uniref:DUF3943 domain-containing protein n=1 Tax=hydrothermal vent metagenome TaxID=652676 RepID=A0A3B1BWD6_9ZZZZ